MANSNATQYQKDYAREMKRINQFMRRAKSRDFIFPSSIIPEKPEKITKSAVSRLKKLDAPTLYKKAKAINTETGEIISGTKGRQIERQKAAEKGYFTKLETKIGRQLRETEKQELITKKKKRKKSAQKYKNKESDDWVAHREEQRLKRNAKQRAKYKLNKEKNALRKEQEQQFNDMPYYTPSFSRVVIANFKDTIKYSKKRIADELNRWLDYLISEYGADDVAEMLQRGAEAGIILNHRILYGSDDETVTTYTTAMMNYLPRAKDFDTEELMNAINDDEDWE